MLFLIVTATFYFSIQPPILIVSVITADMTMFLVAELMSIAGFLTIDYRTYFQALEEI